MSQSQPQTPLTFVKGKSMKSGLFAACLLAAASTTLALPLSSPAIAGDLDPQAEDVSDSRFIRMGLDKSVVVRLPAEVRDVVVGNENIVDAVIRRKNMAYLFGRGTGQTNIFFFDADGQQILSLDIEVAQDTLALKKLLSRAMPGHRITVDSANRNLVLGGVARNPLEAKRALDIASQYATQGSFFSSGGSIINTMSTDGEDQVMLKVKVVEIQRDVLKQFGINLSALVDTGKFAFNLASVNPFSQNLLSSLGGYKGTFSSGGTQIQTLVRAMESDGLVRTLAEPNLTAVTGATAKFEAGGEFPYQECDRVSTSTTSSEDCEIKFKEYGVSVNFTPTVLSEGRINLQITTQVSELSTVVSGNTNVPGVNKRSATTTLEMPSGGTMMLAGLIRESTRQSINGTPGLKKLPVLGALFRSRDFIANETELVIMATPYLVRHTSEDQVTTPDEGLNPATEKQAIFMGKLNKVYGQGTAPHGSYNGNVGFIVE
jgi:pilus assembly protein CpaC